MSPVRSSVFIEPRIIGVTKMADKFKVGEKVRLKSGGPKMTVSKVQGQGLDITCTWFKDGKKKDGRFDAETLEHVD
jgi:uncharacterized protein YodC (DUF2158 family)